VVCTLNSPLGIGTLSVGLPLPRSEERSKKDQQRFEVDTYYWKEHTKAFAVSFCDFMGNVAVNLDFVFLFRTIFLLSRDFDPQRLLLNMRPLTFRCNENLSPCHRNGYSFSERNLAAIVRDGFRERGVLDRLSFGSPKQV